MCLDNRRRIACLDHGSPSLQRRAELSGDRWQAEPAEGILRDHFCRQDRSCTPARCRARRYRVHQHLERNLLWQQGAHGGTGIFLYKDWLYAELNDKIVRYPLKAGEVAPTGTPETILSGMPITGDHPMHGFAIDNDGNLFVEMGSATNACEKQNRMPHSPGNDPCTELETRAGIWRYDANKTNQVFSPRERYA